jgi:hypothetical protein
MQTPRTSTLSFARVYLKVIATLLFYSKANLGGASAGWDTDGNFGEWFRLVAWIRLLECGFRVV